MKTILKCAAAVTLAGAFAVALSTPSEARHGRNAAAAIGFGAGALAGAVAANAMNNADYTGPGYGGQGFYSTGGYAYGSGPYAYEPGMGYGSYGGSGCTTEGVNGHVDYFGC